MKKVCSKCGKKKNEKEFNKQASSKDGLSSWCKCCCNELAANYRKKVGIKELSKRRKESRLRNPERTKRRDKENRERNKYKIKAFNKAWKKENRAYCNKKQREHDYRRKQEDEIYKCKEGIRCNIKQTFKTMCFTKDSNTGIILGCDYKFFKQYIETQFKEGMNWDNHGKWHYDHVIPISLGNTYEEIVRLNHYTNFQPLWAIDNLMKRDKIIEGTQLILV